MSRLRIVDSILCLYQRVLMCCLRPNKNLQWNTNKEEKKLIRKLWRTAENRQSRRRMLILIKVLAFFFLFLIPRKLLFFSSSNTISFRHYFNDTHVLSFLMTFVVVGSNEECFVIRNCLSPPTRPQQQQQSLEATSKLCTIPYNWFDLIWWRLIPSLLCIFDCSLSISLLPAISLLIEWHFWPSHQIVKVGI